MVNSARGREIPGVVLIAVAMPEKNLALLLVIASRVLSSRQSGEE
jgi:hypothetical protein